MKVIITGSTGTVGSAVLERCLSYPEITSVVALTRRPLESKDPKLNNIIHKDFLHYDQTVIDQLKGAEACIWALGSPSSGKEVHIDYTNTAVKMFLDSIVPQTSSGKPFRFVYTSGGLVPYLDSNLLFFLGSVRKIRGNLDRDLVALEKQHPGRWESFVVRPWFVVDEKPRIASALGENSYVFRSELGAAMVDAALNGNEERIITNTALRVKGQRALEEQE